MTQELKSKVKLNKHDLKEQQLQIKSVFDHLKGIDDVMISLKRNGGSSRKLPTVTQESLGVDTEQVNRLNAAFDTLKIVTNNKIETVEYKLSKLIELVEGTEQDGKKQDMESRIISKFETMQTEQYSDQVKMREDL